MVDILAAGELKQRAEEKSQKKTLIALHPDDRLLYDSLELQCRYFGVPLRQYLSTDFRGIALSSLVHLLLGLCIKSAAMCM